MNINRKRIASEADEAAAVAKVFHTDIFNGSAKGGERRVHRLGVGRVRFYEYVQILGGAGLGVKRDGIAPNDKVLTLWACKADKRSLKSWYIQGHAFQRVRRKGGVQQPRPSGGTGAAFLGGAN